MKLRNITFTILTLLFAHAAHAQKKDSTAIVTYIRQYKDIAMQEMKRSGIPASITLAQGIHESSFGTSYLSKNTNNHFGIKCKENWTGKTFKYTDDAPNECFRVYDKVEDSYRDHSDFLRNRPYYTPLFKLDIYDYKAWSYGLKKSGYATNPKYAEILIKTIEDYQLYAFDKGVLPSYLSTDTASAVEGIEEDGYNVTDSIQIDVQKIEIPEKKTEVATPTPAAPTPLVTTNKVKKTIFKVNDCKAVKIYKGETLDLLSNVLNIDKADLLAFNDITDETQIKEGQTIFIQHKKKSSKEGTYKVKQEDNIWSISQKKGIRLASLLRINKLEPGEEPAPKEIISLKEKVREKPALRETTEPKKDVLATVKTTENTIVRARDTIYPALQDTIKLSVDSNTVLGWENDTKLKEKTDRSSFPASDTSTKTIPPVKEAQPAQNTGTAETTTPTVYPKVIDYKSLPKSTTGTHTVIKGDTMYNVAKRYNISIPQIMEWNNLSDQSVKLGQVLKIQP